MANKNTKLGKTINKSKQVIKKEILFSKPVLIICLILVVVVIASFFKTLGYDFIFLDDNFLINGWFKGSSMNIHNVYEVFRRSIGDSFYRPILALTVIWDEGIGGILPYQYHLTNMILYIFSSILIYLLLIKLRINYILAASLAFLFIIHPLNAPAIAWIFGRNEPLLTIFFLTSLIFLIYSFDSKNYTKKYIYITLHLLFYLISLYSKETALVIPVVFISLSYLFYKDKVKSREFIFLVSSWAVFAIVWLLSRQSVLGAIHSSDIIGFEALVRNWKSFFALIGKIFIPQSLALNSYYDNLSVFGGILFFIALIFLSLYPKINSKKKIFGLIWFVFFLLPPLFIISSVDFDYAEHRAFLPMIGLIIMLAELIESFNFDYKKLSFRIPVIVIFLVFLIRTQMYIPVFENHSTFWSNLPKTYPDRQIAYAIAGGVLFNENFVDESLKLLTDGENAPIKNTTLYFNLATVNMSRNNFEKVEYYSKKGLEIDSNNSKLYVKWAISKLKMMDTAGSIEKYGKAIEKNSKNTEALSNLSLIYMMKKDVPNAIKYLEISIAVDKSNSNNFNNLGVCYFNSGNKQKAEEAWLEAVKNPKLNNDAYNNLIMFYTKSNISKSLELANELSKRGGKLKPELRKALYGN